MSPWGFGRGFGPNPFWNCRWFPWLPRWWWAYPPDVLAQMMGQSIPQQPPPDQPVGSQPGQALGPTFAPFGPFTPPSPMGTITKEQEIQLLEQQTEFLRQQLEQLQKRLKELTDEE
ncbi:MAG: DUF5320 domain-containing protein [Candidatus Hodarchaeota archaeon]